VVTISITVEAYEATQATLPKDADAWHAEPDDRGSVRLTLDHKTLDRLSALRGPRESYSDVLLRLARA
jgi:predicted CopG family antitoxin